jgi:FKBP12-rapamycin complex-associated protein
MNGLLHNSDIPLRSHLPLTIYKITPITTQLGLIGWVHNSIPLGRVIAGIRARNQQQQFAEDQAFMRELAKGAPLSDAFGKALAASQGNEIATALVKMSSDSAQWLERRVCFTTSLASTSMASYVLGIGDRHTQYILMKTTTGGLVHSEFTSCFEDATRRPKFPERVPFRLTRMLVNALEVSGIEGTFRSCCENVLGLIRTNAEEILALLEIFINDPIVIEVGTFEQSGNRIVARIAEKMKGQEFGGYQKLNVQEQVDRLIVDATNPENLAAMWRGWAPWW